MYIRLCNGLVDKGILLKESEIHNHINSEHDWYRSLFFYNEEQFKQFKISGSVKGIRETVTNKFFMDFDDTENINVARYKTLSVIDRLKKYGITEKNIEIYFSGSKGFNLSFELPNNVLITPRELANIVEFIGADIGYDTTMYDANQIIRIPGTRHQKSGLYKIPLTYKQLKDLEIEKIKVLASDINNIKDEFNWEVANPNDDFYSHLFEKTNKEAHKDIHNLSTRLDFSKKPKFLSNCRWSMQNGHFKEGERSTAFLCLGATYKNQGFELEHVYRLLKGVAELQAKVNNSERFDDTELYNNVTTQLFSEGWQNGQFSCKDKGSWLYSYCKKLGEHSCVHDEKSAAVETKEIFNMFQNYVDNYEQNILTTGIADLDSKIKFNVGTFNAILAAPGIGKTSLSLQILNHNSKQSVPCIFFSYDMFHAAIMTRMVQRHTGLSTEEVYEVFGSNTEKAQAIRQTLGEEYKNVFFCFKSGQTSDEIEQTITDIEKRTNTKIKLAIVDYNELISAKSSDPTAASAETAQRLRQIANDQQLCMITLLQPSKMFTTPADEITTYTAAKGSSSIAQSVTVMLGCNRPGFNVLNQINDKFFSITCLKNRNGPLFMLDFKWDGLRGSITKLDDVEKSMLREIREEKKKQEKSSGW